VHVGADGAADGRGLPRGHCLMKVSAIVISTGAAEARLLAGSVPALRPQVDELVVVANGPNSVTGLPEGVRVLENAQRRGFSANSNTAIATTAADYRVGSNQDAIPEPDAVAQLVAC